MNKKTISKIKNQMDKLIKKNGVVTTLEVKEACIAKYPDLYWTQNKISDLMDHVYQKQLIKELGYADNGTFRQYSITPVKPVEFKSRTALVELISVASESDKDITVSFVKSDLSIRVITGFADQVVFQTAMGYINFHENGELRNVDPRTVYQVETSTSIFKLKR